MIQRVRGFRDILPPGINRWQYVENTAKNILENYGFREVRLPILERTELFLRSIGETTDIVEKEMYSFIDKDKSSVTLRPEATAGVVRAFIQHGLYNQIWAKKLYTIGPMFRRERPQRGRYRQFWQINAEIIGYGGPLADAEIISALDMILKALKIKGYEIQLNSLGCKGCRPYFKEALIDYLSNKVEGLCPDCRRRQKLNPLRVFDCKVEGCRKIILDAPRIIDYLCPDCQRHFIEVQDYLREMGIEFKMNPYLVRGLDYYTRTTFEVIAPGIGAQNAIAGGGRYDELIKELGGRPTPAIGFAIGTDRLLSLLPEIEENRRPLLFLALLDDEGVKIGLNWARKLRQKGIWVEMGYNRSSLKSQMNKANKLNARFVLIIGEEERKKGKAILRNMDTKVQVDVPISPDKGIPSFLSQIKNKEGTWSS